MPSVPVSEKFKARFWAKVNVAGAGVCWEWTASLSAHGGYGQITAGRGVLLKAHRVAYTLANGEPPQGAFICHTCNNARCCNPAHLYAGTAQTNWDDARASGRAHKFQPKKLQDSPCAKLTNDQAREVLASPLSGVELARKFGVTPATISCIRRGKSWKTL